jgi:isoleucyl-tRNA synthetase
VGSRKELYEMSGNEEAKTVELHRPYIDAITLKCPECGGEMHRVPEVIDCWFDSGAMPFAQHHYPFENKEIFEEQFPAEFISEAVDQTRGWFHSLMAISTMLFNKAPYRNVIVLGHVQDENGQKMSKSKGNAVDPFDALERHGADAIRWYFYTNSAPWLPSRFSDKAVTEGQRGFMGTLWNTYAFWVLYAEIDQFDASKYSLDDCKLTVMDKFILSRLNTMVKDMDRELGAYHIPEAARALSSFVDELSNWYVRRSRERFWVQSMTDDKIAAYMTLYTCLVTCAKAAAPMIPFMTEDMYRNLVCSVDASAPESVHLCDYPVVDEKRIDKELEDNMEFVLDVVVLGRGARNSAAIKNRQPLSALYVNSDRKAEGYFADIIRDELNVRSVEFVSDMSAFSSYSFKPQLKTVGPKYGKLLGGIRSYLDELSADADAAAKAMETLRAGGKLTITVGGDTAELGEEDLLIDVKQKEGFCTVSDKGISVALDTVITPELLEEGIAREIVSKIQTMRKEADFNVTDHINVSVTASESISQLVLRRSADIRTVVLGDSLTLGEALPVSREWSINGENVTISVERV